MTLMVFTGVSFAQTPTVSPTPVALQGTPAVGAGTPVAVTPSPAAKKLAKRLVPEGEASPELENIRKALEALPPEQRQAFRENFMRWINLSTEEKKSLRDQVEVRRKQMADEIAAGLKESGLQLDAQKQKAFAKRYTQERRKVEEELRAESEAKRQARIAEFLSRLKTEFSTP